MDEDFCNDHIYPFCCCVSFASLAINSKLVDEQFRLSITSEMTKK